MFGRARLFRRLVCFHREGSDFQLGGRRCHHGDDQVSPCEGGSALLAHLTPALGHLREMALPLLREVCGLGKSFHPGDLADPGAGHTGHEYAVKGADPDRGRLAIGSVEQEVQLEDPLGAVPRVADEIGVRTGGPSQLPHEARARGEPLTGRAKHSSAP